MYYILDINIIYLPMRFMYYKSCFLKANERKCLIENMLLDSCDNKENVGNKHFILFYGQ